MDHYDAWNYIIIGPLSLITSLSFIFLNIYFKNTRKFPGNLLIIISIAEVFLCIHWILSGIYTPYIQGTTIEENGLFCKANSHIAFVAASLELTFQFSFLISIILQFQDTMRKIKFQSLFLILPLAVTIGLWALQIKADTLGLNIFGTCSVKKSTNSFFMFLVVNSAYCFVVLLTVYTIRKYKKLSENRITIRDDFLNFYLQYAVLTFFMYLSSGSSFMIDNYILKKTSVTTSEEGKHTLLMWFYISRLTNNVKIFIPFFTFLLRINDPFIQKLLKNLISQKGEKSDKGEKGEKETNLSQLSDDQVLEEDYLVNNQVKQIRQGIARSLLKGISDYYNFIFRTYQEIDDENIRNLIANQIEEEFLEATKDSDGETKKTLIEDEKFFKCSMQSMFTKKFQRVIDSGKFQDMQESFLVEKNKQAIAKSGDSDGGAGGEFFLLTHDKKFFIKTITVDEEAVFTKIIEDYVEHLSTQPGSFITKIIGYFVFDLEVTKNSLKVIVFENVFKKKPGLVKRRFDMKGSTFSRQVLSDYSHLAPNERIQKTLKDLDFDHLEKEIVFGPETK